MLNADIRRALEGTSLAHLATGLPDGSPHTVPVWIGTRGEQVAFFTGPGSRKARNLRRDPRVALSLTPTDDPYTPIVVRGRVTEWIDGDAGWKVIDEIAARYTGAPYPRDDERVVAVIEPEHQRVGIG